MRKFVKSLSCTKCGKVGLYFSRWGPTGVLVECACTEGRKGKLTWRIIQLPKVSAP